MDIFTVFDKELNIYYIEKFINNWNKNNLKILILEDDYNNNPSLETFKEYLIIYKNVKDVPNEFIYKFLLDIYPCIYSNKVVLIIPPTLLINSNILYNDFIDSINTKFDKKYISIKLDNEIYIKYSNTNILKSIYKIFNNEGINIMISYLYNLFYNSKNKIPLDEFFHQFINEKINNSENYIESNYSTIFNVNNNNIIFSNNQIENILTLGSRINPYPSIFFNIIKPINLYKDLNTYMLDNIIN